MKALAQEQARTAIRRNSLTAALFRQAKAISATARVLHDTKTKITSQQHQLAQGQQQHIQVQKKIRLQHAAITALLRATYALGQRSDLRLLLDGHSVSRIALARQYSRYFGQNRIAKINRLMVSEIHLQQLQSTIRLTQKKLQVAQSKQRDQLRMLRRQWATRQKLLQKTRTTYAAQGHTLAVMKRNEASLNQLMNQLTKLLETANEQVLTGKIAGHRGYLPWPASGAINDQGHGVLIHAASGSKVRAIASGQVIYAHFLRGYGLLVIVDHGDGWMSMYGNNETLHHDVGDTVYAGTVLGTTLPGLREKNGVYFELRHRQKPVNPRAWLKHMSQ